MYTSITLHHGLNNKSANCVRKEKYLLCLDFIDLHFTCCVVFTVNSKHRRKDAVCYTDNTVTQTILQCSCGDMHPTFCQKQKK